MQWEIFMLGKQGKLLSVVKWQWTCSGLGWWVCPWVMHILLWVRLCSHHFARGSWVPTSLGAVFPLRVCSTTAACSPAAACGSPNCSHHTNSGGSCLLASLWMQPHHKSFFLVSTQQGLSHEGVFCHYSLLHLLRASISQQHSSLWSNPSWVPPSLCPDILLGFILPQSLLCLARVFPAFTRCCLPGWEVSLQSKGIASAVLWAVPGDSAHALHTALAGWAPSSCWKSWERPEIFHSLGALSSLWGHFFLDVSSFGL